MKKATMFLTLALAALILFVSCGEDPFFHTVKVINGDKTTETVVFDGDEYTLPANSDAEFLGWKVNDDKYIKAPGEKVTVNGDVAVKAIYTDTDDDSVCLLVYVLTDPDGNFTGSFTSESTKRAVVPEGEVEILKAKDVTCEGAAFDGWYTDKDADGNRTRYTNGDTIEVTKFTKLYANWIDDNLVYEPSNSTDSTYKVSAKDKTATSYKISSWLEGKKVTVIKETGFTDCTNLTSITLPDTIKTISQYAFSACSNLTSCNLPDGLETIGKGAFMSSDLTGKVVIPSSVTSLGESCFNGSKNLTSVEFEAGCQITEIPYGAFTSCESITRVDIPDSVTEIRNGAFCDCSDLAEINIGAGIITIDVGAFDECPYSLKINIQKTTAQVEAIAGYDVCWRNIDSSASGNHTKVYSSEGLVKELNT